MNVTNLLPKDFPWLDKIHCYDSVDSTNLLAKTMAAQGAPSGTVILAQHQTAGRGRMGRSFHSPSGQGIYLSVILRPESTAKDLMHLTCAVGTVMCNAVEDVCGFRPGIKWINDLVLNERKVGGILVEMGLKADGNVDFAVVGIGINCTQKENDFPEEIRHIAASLSQVTGKTISPDAVAASMITQLQILSASLFSQKMQLMEQYRRDCITLGKEVILHKGTETKTAFAIDVDDSGGLIVRDRQGLYSTVQSGEVSVRGLYSYV